MTCTFFGHSDCPVSVKPRLREEIEKMIKSGADLFLVGNNGYFDLYVQQILQELHAEYSIVLAYMPNERTRFVTDSAKTLLPDGIESIIPRFAISYRNKWMIKKADCVITYVKRPVGGAHQFAALAEKQGKLCINIAE